MSWWEWRSFEVPPPKCPQSIHAILGSVATVAGMELQLASFSCFPPALWLAVGSERRKPHEWRHSIVVRRGLKQPLEGIWNAMRHLV